MEHTDHVDLVRSGIPDLGGVWAEFGAGRGALTLALADLIGPTGEIFALDRDGNALKANARNMRAQFPQCSIHYQVADFTQALDLPPLDGILIANGLHFQRNPLAVLRLGHCYLQTDGRVVVVEYNVTKASGAVPFPVPYPRWYRLAEDAGFRHTALLATRPSRTLREIYSAVSW